MEPALSKNETPNEDVEILTGELDQEGPDYSSESDLLFRTQMRIADAFYAHWKKGLAGLVAFLAVVLVYGIWTGKKEAAQQDASQKLAALDRKLPAVNLMQLQGDWGLDDPSDETRIKTLTAIAGKLEEFAADFTGPTAAEAWLRAGDTWKRTGDLSAAKEAYEKVLEVSSGELFTVGARNGLASLALTAGNGPVAIEHYQAIAADSTNAFGEAALIDLARAARFSGNMTQAGTALDELESRYPDHMRGPEVEWEREQIAAANAQ